MYSPDISHGNSQALERFMLWVDAHDESRIKLRFIGDGGFDCLPPEAQQTFLEQLSPGINQDWSKHDN